MTHNIKNVGDDGTPKDLISELPRNVIDCILERIPIQDAAKTTILSKKWRNLWLSVPRLEFCPNFFRNVWLDRGWSDQDKVHLLITEILLIHEGTIRDFVLTIPSWYSSSIDNCLCRWMLHLSKSHINSLVLLNQQPDRRYIMSSYLFLCLHLTYLELEKFELKLPPPDFRGFKSLIRLHMYDIIIAPSLLETLISGSVSLEELKIWHCLGFSSLNISAPRLKVLFISSDQTLKSICFKNVQNLVDLTIKLERSIQDDGGGRRSNLINFLSSVPKIEKLCLANGFIKFLAQGSIPDTLPKMVYTLKHLELHGISLFNKGHVSLLACLLKSSPNLVTLKVKINNLDFQPAPRCIFRELLCDDGCSHTQLKTVTMEMDFLDNLAVGLAKYVLANSPFLKLLTFKVSLRESNVHRILVVTRELLYFVRASPKAHVNLVCL